MRDAAAERAPTAVVDHAQQRETQPGQAGFTDRRRVTPADANEGAASTGEQALSAEEQQEVERLERRDAEVRKHEQAHAAAGGQHAGSPSYEYETGPDGRRYAVSGEVSISTSEIAGDPDASIAKLEQVARAATAPAQPSAQDLKVAAQARATLARLRAERAREPNGETRETGGVRQRAAMAYQKIESPALPVGAQLSITACGSCGRGHG